MNKEEIKLSDKELQKCLDELHGTNFLNAFCILDWILKTRKENEELQQENQQLKQKYEIQKDSNKLLCKAIACDDCNCSVCEAHKRNIDLQQKIEKAIEYINGAYEMACYTKSISLDQENIEELLEILKGEEK